MGEEGYKRRVDCVFIPGEMAFNTNFCLSAKFVFWIVKSLDHSEKHCTASNAYIAKSIGLKERSVSKHISDLIKDDYLMLKSVNKSNKRVLSVNPLYLTKHKHWIDKYNDNTNSWKINTEEGDGEDELSSQKNALMIAEKCYHIKIVIEITIMIVLFTKEHCLILTNQTLSKKMTNLLVKLLTVHYQNNIT